MTNDPQWQKVLYGFDLDFSPSCSHGRAVTYFLESINSDCPFTTSKVCVNHRDIPELVGLSIFP